MPNWVKTDLLNRYYEKVAIASTGGGQHPRFTTFEAGYGLLDFSGVVTPGVDKPTILEIPLDETETPDVFYTGSVTASWDGTAKQVAMTCIIPVGAVSVARDFSVLGIKDQEGDLVALAAFWPDTITPTDTYTLIPKVAMPIR